MKTILFKIITLNPIPIEIPIEIMRKYPTNEHYLKLGKEVIVTYSFDTRQLTQQQQDKYVKWMENHLKRKYKAYSIEVGEMQKQIKPH